MKKIIVMMSLLLLFVVSCGSSKEFSIDVDGKGKVPNFELKDLNGKTIDSGKILNNGKKTLFIVAAEWCPHCKEEMPEVQKFYDANKDKVNVVVVFTNNQSSLGKVQTYVKNNEYTFPVFFDSNNDIIGGFKVQAFPFNLKADGDKVSQVYKGEVTYDLLVQEFSK